MEELIQTLMQFDELIIKQCALFEAFVPLLDEEETAISNHSLIEMEQALIKKDQHTKIAQSIEEKRVILVKKIFYFMAYDARDQNLSLNLFKNVFTLYVDNVKNLIDKKMLDEIISLKESIFYHVDTFLEIFYQVSGRIYRNQEIVKKMVSHIHFSLNLFQSEAGMDIKYDSYGKSHSKLGKQGVYSNIRVRA
jgi:hypothetical protein